MLVPAEVSDDGDAEILGRGDSCQSTAMAFWCDRKLWITLGGWSCPIFIPIFSNVEGRVIVGVGHGLWWAVA